MGASLSGVLDKLFGNRKARILLMGLGAAGKSTILYKLKLNETIDTMPTVGFNCEQIEHKNLDLTIWDFAGQLKLRELWSQYYKNTHAVIFVIDSADCESLSLAKETLEYVLAHKLLRNAVLLVLANKQDLPQAQTTEHLTKYFELTEMKRKWHIQGTCARTGEGLLEGMDWIAESLDDKSLKRL